MTKITKPGLYPSIPERDYHADPCPEPSLNNSVAVVLAQKSPAHAYVEHPRLGGVNEYESASALDIGSAIHAGVLGGEAALHVINADNYKTKDAQQQRQSAWEAGKIPLLAHQFEDVKNAIAAAREQIRAHEIAADWFADSPVARGEQTIAWQETIDGFTFWCRARIDWLPHQGEAVDDLKTTTGAADPDTWSRRIFDGGYDMQSAFYSRGLRALGLRKRPAFRFIVLEQNPPYALFVVALDPQAVVIADEKVTDALKLWAHCLRTKTWPGYPSRICYAEAPPWEVTKHELRKERGRYAREVGGGLTAGLIHWQAPAHKGEAA